MDLKTDFAISRPIVVTVCMSGSPNRGRPSGDLFNGTYVPVEEPSTASIAAIEVITRRGVSS
jgi:hypothetical protein